ncbi:MAG: hypothetical protein GX962_13830 [Epulopiscium sp.]|nr:hypothetical protein [Candidatus Epulonipiscium sp.]
MLKQKRYILDEKIKEGIITQEEAEEIYSNIKDRSLLCDGMGNSNISNQHRGGLDLGVHQGLGIRRGLGQGKDLGIRRR